MRIFSYKLSSDLKLAYSTIPEIQQKMNCSQIESEKSLDEVNNTSNIGSVITDISNQTDLDTNLPNVTNSNTTNDAFIKMPQLLFINKYDNNVSKYHQGLNETEIDIWVYSNTNNRISHTSCKYLYSR